VRAYWDGRQLLSRLGNRFHAPPWFLEQLPTAPLDGELWTERKQFQRTISIVRRQDQGDGWRAVRFVVFDAPAHDGPFEERLAWCRETLRDLGHVSVHEHVPCDGLEHLRAELARVEALGGEGLMLRQPASRYEVGRSTTLLKVKSFHDAEARVVGYVAGAGRHKGRVGALDVALPDGTRFAVGTGLSDAERSKPPPIGAVITFRYQEFSEAGVPRFPTYVGVRDDVRLPTLPTPSAARRVRRFEKREPDGTRKFWEIEVDGSRHRVRFGVFEAKTKTFTDAAQAAAELEARIAEKLGRGFEEVP
jgi:DNA ligase-1